MNSAADMAIKVTVDEPYSAEVTMEQVRAYLREKGWEEREGGTRPSRHEQWVHGEREDWWLVFVMPTSATDITKNIRWIAHDEDRSPAAVLREIAGEVEERPTRAELLAAVDGARDALIRADALLEALPLGGEATELHGAMNDIHEALSHAGCPRDKSPSEVRAHEIDVEAAKQQRPLTVEDAMRFAREAHDDVARALGEKSRDSRRTDAAAWLIVAQRLLAREAAR